MPLGHKPADMAMRCIPKVAYKSHGSMAWLQYDLAAARGRGAQHCVDTWKRSYVYASMTWYHKQTVVPG